MLIYSFDYVTGALTSAKQLTVGDLDPRAPGTMLVAGNATLVKPPRCGVGLWPFWRGGRWIVYQEIVEPDNTMLSDYYANM